MGSREIVMLLKRRIGNRFLISLLALMLFFFTLPSVTSPQNLIKVCPVGCDYTSIQAAANNASEGDVIIVGDGIYIENVLINKSLIFRSENGSSNCIIQALDLDEDVIQVNADYVNITGFTITGGTARSNDGGIDVEYSNFTGIFNNVIYNTYDGIQLEFANFSRIENNTITNNIYGIEFIDSSFNNAIINNTITNVNTAIMISSCYNNLIYLNRFGGNSYNAIECGVNQWNSTEIREYIYQGIVYNNYTGNYWDDYTGVDTNGDGIGDQPYHILSESDIYGGEGCSISSYDYYPMLLEIPFPPTISNIQERDLTNESITISWQTNVLSNNRILYSLNPDLSPAAWSSWDNNTQNPSITLSGLLANTTYYYSIFSYRVDNTSLYSNSSIGNFTTKRNPVIWIVDDDSVQCPNANFTKIQDAVNASLDGDTILVCNGTYVGNVWVNKTLNITGIDNPVVDANGVGSGFTLKSNGNIIQGFYINNSGYGTCYGAVRYSGIKVGYTTYLVTGLGDCIMITDYESTDNIIRNNTFNQSGIFIVKGYIISSSDRNLITNNTFISSYLEIEGSKYNTITSNTFIEGGYSKRYISIEGLSYKHATGNRIENNTFMKNVSDSMPMVWISSYAEQNIISGNELLGYGGIRVDSDNNQIINNRISGITPMKKDDASIKIDHASNCIISNNTVEYKYTGLEIWSSSAYVYSTNLTLRNNTLTSNRYNFYIDPGNYEGSWGGVVDEDFDLDIDTSNTVNGFKIYYLKNESNKIFNSTTLPYAGFFACINCSNITLEGFGFNANSHGVLLYKTKDSSISVFSAYNALSGIAAYNSTNITVMNSTLDSNGEEDQNPIILNWGAGIYFGKTNSSEIINCEINDNEIRGISFDYSHNNSIYDSELTNNGEGTSAMGLYFYESDNNVVFSCNITGTGTRQKYGIYLYSSNNNTIYNNYFNNVINAYDDYGYNSWNITKTPGINIINGPYLGGNYWHDYTGMDTIGGDGLGDTEIPYNSSGKIKNGGDYRPLTNVAPDYIPPTIYIVSPAEGRTYSASYVYLEVYSPDPDVYKWWYSLNSGANVTFTPNTTISGLSNGAYYLKVYVNDTAGNINSSTVNFTISIPITEGEGFVEVEEKPLEEVMQPDFEILITNPENKFYSQRDLVLSFISPLPLRRASYILDQNEPEIISLAPYATSGTKEINRLLLGWHKIIVNGEDYYGRRGRGEVEFEIIPLTLGEVDSVGTRTSPRFIDDAAFSFYGRAMDYILKFEAKGEVNIDIYINKYYRDGIQSYGNLPSALIYSFQPLLSYQTYEIPISYDNITEDAENIVSFVSKNAETGGAKDWEVKNVSLIPALPFSFPQIRVFTFDKSISENESMIPLVKLDGIINESDYSAYIYLLTPDGKKLYYPDWSGEEKPINSYYLRTNYYGRLSSILEFNDTFTPGTYILAGKITRINSDAPISLSTDKFYYNNQTSVRIYINRETFADNQKIMIEHMLTGNATQNGTLFLSMENPSGEQVYLPALSAKVSGSEYIPVKSDYFIALEEKVDSNWREGIYVVRSNLYSEEGDLIAEDIQTFDVCRKQATISGIYLRNASDNDTSAFILSRIKLIDFYTLETEEKEFTGDHYGYSITTLPGKYYLTGEFVSRNGNLYTIPLIMVTLKCGDIVQQNIILEYTGKIDTERLGISSSSLASSLEFSTTLSLEGYKWPLQLTDASSTCSKPKVAVVVSLSEEAAELYLADLGERGENITHEMLKRGFSIKIAQYLRSTSPGVEIFSYGEIMDALEEVKEFMAENPGANPDLSKISPMRQIEYVYSVKISAFGLHEYSIQSSLIERENALVVHPTSQYSLHVINLDAELDRMVHSLGNIEPIIKAHETTHPVPPRDPNIEITLEPERVSPESELSRKSLIIAKITNCYGEPVYYRFKSQRVFFQKNTERGTVKTKLVGEYISTVGVIELKDYELDYTSEGGIAHAHYTLTKGIEAGEDKVTIITFGRGHKRVTATAVIKIAGIGIEAKPEKSVLAPRQDTLIHIYLYEIDKDGNRKPLEAKVVNVDKSYLKDSELFPLVATDMLGNPKTDYEGRATLKFIAGKKEGLIKIPVKYQTELGEVHDEAFIKVKKEGVVVKILWTQSYRLSGGYGVESDYSLLSGTHRSSVSASYSKGYTYTFSAKVLWERKTLAEKTSSKMTLDLYDNYEYQSSSDADYIEAGWHDIYTGYGSKTRDGAVEISSDNEDFETRGLVGEDREGNLWIFLNEIPIVLHGSGYSNSRGGGTLSGTACWGDKCYSHSSSVHWFSDVNCNYEGVITIPYPGPPKICCRRIWEYHSDYQHGGGDEYEFGGVPYSYDSWDFGIWDERVIKLERTGKDSWKPYKFHKDIIKDYYIIGTTKTVTVDVEIFAVRR